MQNYWSERFKAGGRIWGDMPSISAKHAAVLFETGRVQSVLVPGCGYGRHTEYFDSKGFDVEGIEIAPVAVDIARKANPNITYYQGSVLDMPFTHKKYDAVYCFNVLHLFVEAERARFIENCATALKKKGYVYFTVFSELEDTFGKGSKTEENTFESKPGRPVHYFTEEDLKESFGGFEVLDSGIIDEHEDHGEAGPHLHRLRYIFARKS